MGYKQLVEGNVRKAFNLLKDLAVEVVFTRKNGQAFDFGTADVTTTLAPTVIAKVVVVETVKVKERNTVRKTLMFKSKDVGDIKTFETVTLDGVVWNIGEVPKNDGYIVMVNIFKEV